MHSVLPYFNFSSVYIKCVLVCVYVYIFISILSFIYFILSSILNAVLNNFHAFDTYTLKLFKYLSFTIVYIYRSSLVENTMLQICSYQLNI
jgi:hypothetical protein